ncbi:hypothetical protein OBJ98_05915 [Empedobacter falsenii]
MATIKITNTIEESKILIGFNFQDGSLSFPAVEINTEGDIDFNFLILKLTECMESNRILEIEFLDEENLSESNSKIGLVKTTLIEIYDEFNANVLESSEESEEITS